jgi:type I restriction enzyme S subunit
MVEWKKLGEVFNTRNGYTPSTSNEQFWKDGIIPWFKMEDIRDNGRILSDSYLHITPQAVKGKGLFKANSIILATSATIGEHALVLVDFLCNQRFTNLSLKENYSQSVDMKYVYYYMFIVDEWCKQHVNQGGFASVDMTGLYNLSIPIPSLEEQTRIVGILDTFTSAIDNLKEQIAQRRKQYEYYRDQLLDLEGKPGVEMKTLGEVCEIKGRIGFRGYTREDQVEEGEGVISLSPGNIENGQMVYKGCTYITWEKYEESPEIKTYDGDILFCKTGSTVGKVAMVKELPCEATINPQLVVLKNITIDSKFLNYILGTYTIQSTVKRLAGVGSVPNISQEKLGNLKIPLPPLSDQQRIVSILDTFEASIQNLEAQLKQREKQYEYYRNKLLTFERDGEKDS